MSLDTVFTIFYINATHKSICVPSTNRKYIDRPITKTAIDLMCTLLKDNHIIDHNDSNIAWITMTNYLAVHICLLLKLKYYSSYFSRLFISSNVLYNEVMVTLFVWAYLLLTIANNEPSQRKLLTKPNI